MIWSDIPGATALAAWGFALRLGTIHVCFLFILQQLVHDRYAISGQLCCDRTLKISLAGCVMLGNGHSSQSTAYSY